MSARQPWAARRIRRSRRSRSSWDFGTLTFLFTVSGPCAGTCQARCMSAARIPRSMGSARTGRDLLKIPLGYLTRFWPPRLRKPFLARLNSPHFWPFLAHGANEGNRSCNRGGSRRRVKGDRSHNRGQTMGWFMQVREQQKLSRPYHD